MPELLAVVEVEYDQRVRCQALGCGHGVYRRIHVVSDPAHASGLLVLGSSCCVKLYGFGEGKGAGPSYGSSEGKKLTDDERAMLANNTQALIDQMRAEHAAELDRRRIAEEARAAERARLEASARADSEERRRAMQPRELDFGTSGDWGQSERASIGTDSLSRWRAQQATNAARTAMLRVPELAQHSIERVIAAMVQAKARCISRGLKLDAPGSRQAIEAEAVVLLRERQ